MSDNAFAYRKLNAFARARTPRRPPHPHPALHAALERQGGEIHPDPEEGVGLRPLLAQLGRAHQGHGILPSLLQPASPAQLIGRPAADQPCSQRPWVGQLGLFDRVALGAFTTSEAFVGGSFPLAARGSRRSVFSRLPRFSVPPARRYGCASPLTQAWRAATRRTPLLS